MTKRIGLAALITIFVAVSLGTGQAQTPQKLPAQRAGEILPAQGQIAFVRDKSLWITSVSGTGQRMVQDARNAEGRPSWSLDNRQIIFTRKGGVNLQAPDGMGGFHAVYDLFIAYLDSAETGNAFYYFRPSTDFGSRAAEWDLDGKLTFWKDLNANLLNAGEPNYQLCRMNPDGSDIKVMRHDYQWYTPGLYMTSPSRSKNGLWAFAVINNMAKAGMAVLPEAELNRPMDSIAMLAAKMPQADAPAWSPDGSWLAYVVNDFENNAVMIATPDLKEKFVVFQPPVNTVIYPVPPSWSPDSKWLTFSTDDGSVWIADITGTRVQRVTGPGQDKWPAWSK